MEKPKLNQAVERFFPEKVELARKGLCTDCGKEIKEEDFTDELSKKEYSISGLCQKCQNLVFK